MKRKQVIFIINNGLYFAYEIIEDEIGFDFNISYNKTLEDFQISIMILNIAFAVGWKFQKGRYTWKISIK